MATSTTGLGGDNTLTGTGSADKLVGGGGDDVLDGGAGSDFINAGGGNDTIIYDEADYKILGGGGIDTLWFTGFHQSLNLGGNIVSGIEKLLLGGGGGHQVAFTAADIVRVSDSDQMIITGDSTNHIHPGSGWNFVGLTADGQSQILANGVARLIVSLPVDVEGFSGNASIITSGSMSLTEDSTAPTLTATGTITINDPNAGQGLLLGTANAIGSPLGTLTIAQNQSWSTTGPAIYDYSYSISNDAVQHLGAGKTLTETFTVQTIDGSIRQLGFTTTGVNDPAAIGSPDPDHAFVTEDVGADSNGYLKASGTLSISDADDGEASFNTSITATAGNLGTLTLVSDGGYTYSVANTSVQHLKSGETKVDSFNVQSIDGTTIIVSFTINGADDGIYGSPQNDDNLNGTSGNDFIYGLAGDDRIFGFAGNDLIDGGEGNDPMYGGSGDDHYIVDSISDLITELSSGGIDSVDSSASFVLPVFVENLTLTGTANINGTGNDLANVISGNSGNNTISGGGGDDRIDGFGGFDFLNGGDGDDTLTCGPDQGGAVRGDAGDDTITFFASDETLTLQGGTGSDTFVLMSSNITSKSNVVIQGFDFSSAAGAGGDILDLPDPLSLYSAKISPTSSNSTAIVGPDGFIVLTLIGTPYTPTFLADMISSGHIV